MPPLQTILCALDAERDSHAAAVRAADLAERAHARLHLVYADPVPRPSVGVAPLDRALAQRLAAAVDQALGAEGAFDLLGPEVHVVHGLAPSDAAARLAASLDADLVVVGTHAERGLARALAGSTASETLRRSAAPVLVVPEDCDARPGPDRPVLAAVDFSELSVPALEQAAALAETYQAPVEPVHVLDLGPGDGLDLGGLLTLNDVRSGPDDTLVTQAQRALRQLARRAGLDPETVHVATGAPETAIVRLAGTLDAGAVVLGTHGRTGWDRVRLGSVAEWVVRHAPCPVLAIPSASVR